jgi:hypothetical protein
VNSNRRAAADSHPRHPAGAPAANGDAARPRFDLQRDAWGRLVWTDAEGTRHVGVVPVRIFPLSDPHCWIALCDEDGRELACVENPADLPDPVRRILEHDLAQREFVPVLRRIVNVPGILEPCEWEVETDRGLTRFVLKSEDDVRRLGPYSALIIDGQGIRYLVPDARALDASSRRIIERYI